MGEARTDLLRGTLDLLILKAVALEPLHGVGIARRIEQITKGAFGVSFGSLFPSLHRMEERGWLASEWRNSENNRRAKYLQPHPGGRQTGRNRAARLAARGEGDGGGDPVCVDERRRRCRREAPLAAAIPSDAQPAGVRPTAGRKKYLDSLTTNY